MRTPPCMTRCFVENHGKGYAITVHFRGPRPHRSLFLQGDDALYFWENTNCPEGDGSHVFCADDYYDLATDDHPEY